MFLATVFLIVSFNEIALKTRNFLLNDLIKIEDKSLGDIPWNKTDETYLSDEDVWQVSYFFEI